MMPQQQETSGAFTADVTLLSLGFMAVLALMVVWVIHRRNVSGRPASSVRSHPVLEVCCLALAMCLAIGLAVGIVRADRATGHDQGPVSVTAPGTRTQPEP
ncbi:hypothetical protein ACIRPX_21260 [Streptomyces sp. NPDC101225]|uniref:hypothetical protein n=1 Tax=Streptomyces sp. NPDC101225 TaxID=3366135 RepID=UPI003830631A